jgi:hypothetical protein
VATGKLKTSGVQLLTAAGEDLLSRGVGEAYTWDYAWTIGGGADIKNGTTLPVPIGDGGEEVSRTAESKGLFGRYAMAKGTANATTKAIDMNVKANKLSVAKSITGVGTTLKTAGARAAAVVLTTLIDVALDPQFEIPGEDVLGFDGLGTTKPPLPTDYFVRPAGFTYRVVAEGPGDDTADI